MRSHATIIRHLPRLLLVSALAAGFFAISVDEQIFESALIRPDAVEVHNDSVMRPMTFRVAERIAFDLLQPRSPIVVPQRK